MSTKITQTELGLEFGISSIAMGKKLIQLKLRDKTTKLATDYALKNNLAKIVSYQKGAEIIKMNVWNENTIKYIIKKTEKDFNFCADILLGKIKELKKIEDNDRGQKIDVWIFDSAYESFLNSFKIYSNNYEILTLFLNKLTKENLLNYLERFEDLKNLNLKILNNNLDKKLPIKNIKEEIIKI